MTPKTPEQFESIRAESRELIVDAASTLFARNGYEGTSIRAIAKEAGVSLGLLYNYFEGKEGLLRAIVLRSLADVSESFVRAMNPSQKEDPLERLFRSTIDILRRNRRFWLLFYSIRSQPAVIDRLAPEMAGLSTQVFEGLEQILRASGARQPSVDAQLLFAIIDGISQQFVLDPDSYPAEAVIARALELFAASTT